MVQNLLEKTIHVHLYNCVVVACCAYNVGLCYGIDTKTQLLRKSLARTVFSFF